MCIDLSSATEETLDMFICGSSQTMQRLRADIIRASRWDFPVLIEGETGTGKELVAKLIFALWKKRRKRTGELVCVDSGILRGELLLDRLFGHQKGAFTGATAKSSGIFETADNGAVFFDELGNLPMESQTSLLRVLETQTFTQLGRNDSTHFSARYISATNMNLQNMVKSARFRADLFHRLHRIVFRTPNLREHLADIPVLVSSYLKKLASQIQDATGKAEVSFSAEAMNCMMEYLWPGNVRELYSVLDRALVAMEPGENKIEEDHLFFDGGAEDLSPAGKSAFYACVTMADYDKAIIVHSLSVCKGNVRQTCKRLGISPSTLYRRMKSHGLTLPEA